MQSTLLKIGLISLSLAGCATALASEPASVANTSKGKTLVDAHGMTLYSFDKDTTGKSACNGPCATNWPPLAASSATPAADWTLITRDDGNKQWAYKGRALYTFAKDTAPGDIKGDGFLNNAWHVAQP
jgi:predicted lipoprotein with Yx(FWY)xxD motif